MALGANALITTDPVKAALTIQNDQMDAIIELVITGVSEAIARYCDRPLISAAYTDLKLDGSGLNALQLPAWPISAEPATITEDDTLTLTKDVDYYVYAADGLLRRADPAAIWMFGLKNYKLTYTGGYNLASVPGDLQLAAVIQSCHEYQIFLNRSWGVQSKSIGGSSTTYEQAGLLERVKMLIEPYRRRGV
jgi:hypothetical protein